MQRKLRIRVAGEGDRRGAEERAEEELLLADDLRGGPVERVDDDDWATMRGGWLAEQKGESAASWRRRLRETQARLRTLSGYQEAVLECRPDDEGRRLLGWVCHHVAPCPPPEGTLKVAWQEEREPSRSARPVALTLAAIVEYAFSFESWVAKRAGLALGSPATEVPNEIRTARLTLRRPEPGDGRQIYQAIAESADRLRPTMVWVDDHTSPAVSEALTRDAHLAFLAREDLEYRGFVRGEDGRARFALAVWCHGVDWPPPPGPPEVPGPRIELGYWVRSGHEGQGLVTEAVRAICRLAFDTLACRRLDIRCAASNRRGRRLAERLGFDLEAEHPAAVRLPGGAVDAVCVYRKLDGPACSSG